MSSIVNNKLLRISPVNITPAMREATKTGVCNSKISKIKMGGMISLHEETRVPNGIQNIYKHIEKLEENRAISNYVIKRGESW